jgi:hypothetical protein
MDVFTGRFAFRMLANVRPPKRSFLVPLFKKEDGTIYTGKDLFPIYNETMHFKDMCEMALAKENLGKWIIDYEYIDDYGRKR